MAEDPPDLPYTNGVDTFFCHLPVQQGLAATEGSRVEHKDNCVGWQEMGDVLGWLRGCLFESLSLRQLV